MFYDFLIAPFVEFPFMKRALVGGIAIGIGMAAVTEFADQRLRHPEDFVFDTDIPVLGRLPKCTAQTLPA